MNVYRGLLVWLLKNGHLSRRDLLRMDEQDRQFITQYAKENGFPPFYGKLRYDWQFSESSSDLCYLIGMYVTDGTLSKAYRDGSLNAVSYSTVTPELRDHLTSCLEAIDLPSSVAVVTHKARTDGLFHTKDGTLMHITCYSTRFARWINRVCKRKDHLPPFLFNAPVSHQVAAIAGIIDGDGTVTKNGGIRVRCSDGWIEQFPDLLSATGIRTGGLHIDRILDGGRPYYSISVRRQDFVRLGGRCYHPLKQDRILHAESIYKPDEMRRNRDRRKQLCPICKANRMDEASEMCRECYLQSDKFHDHLKAIAPAGNKAANKARWGYEG